jgi:hypothetical protein
VKDIITNTRLKEVNKELSYHIKIDPALPSGHYELMFAVNCGAYPPTSNSRKIPLEID